MFDSLIVWLATYLVHSTVLFGAVALLGGCGLLRRPGLAETAWRVALYGAFLTASLQSPLHEMFDGRIFAQPFETQVSALAPGIRSSLAAAPTNSGTLPQPSAGQTLGAAPHAAEEIMLPAPLHSVAPFIVGAWLTAALLALSHTLVSAWRLNRQSKTLPTTRNEGLLRLARSFARRHGRRAPAIRVAACWSSPLVLPNGDIFIPQWALDSLDAGQCEAMLAHELAHVMRRDAAWRLAAQLAARLGILQPLNLLAMSRLDLLSELACDSWAARETGRARELAEALYACASRYRTNATPALAMAMARNASPLLQRVDALMKKGAVLLRPPSRAAMVGLVAVLFGGVLTLPILAVGDERSVRFTQKDGANTITASIDGKVVYTPAEDDVVSMTRSATFTQALGDRTYSITFEARNAGEVARAYTVDGKAAPLDAKAREWMGRVIPVVLREIESPATSRQRIEHWMAAGGENQVIEQIGRIQTDAARSRYIQSAAGIAPLAPEGLHPMIDLAAHIRHDDARADALIKLVQTARFDDAAFGAVFASVKTMKSSTDISRVLLAVAHQMPADAELARRYREAARPLAGEARGEVEMALDHLNL